MEFLHNAALVQIVIICKDKHSIHSEMSASRLKEVTLPFSKGFIRRIMAFPQEVTRMSCDDGRWSGKQGVGSQNCLPDIF